MIHHLIIHSIMTRKSRPRIAVFVNHPECSIQSAHGVLRALSLDYDIEFVGPRDLASNNLQTFDILAFPGGIGDSDSFHTILDPYADHVRSYLEHGGRYLGICMGAYWAGPHYFNILRDIDPVQYIRRPDADVRRSFGTVVEVEWLGRTEYMYFYDGCSLLGQKRNFKTIARYANGDPAAIIQGQIGLIGPHPESDIYWYTKPYMQPYWHEYYHHELLINFVQKLLRY